MASIIFNERTFVQGNIFKYEQRLNSTMNKFIGSTAIFCTYFNKDELASTTDRWTGDVDSLFGKEAPTMYNLIKGFPLYEFAQLNVENTDEQQIEDISVEGDFIVLPSTIIPYPDDFFILDHLKNTHLFRVTNVTYDSMRPEGYYKLHYRLESTSQETIQNLLTYQISGRYQFDMNAIGTGRNPVISEEDSASRNQVGLMINQMIKAYRALFYNYKHNCFLFHDPCTGLDYFDQCGNEFMHKHSIMNYENSNNAIVLHQKLIDPQFPIKYNNSIYNWIEMGAPARLLQKFYFILGDASAYSYSSFVEYGDDNVQIIHPISPNEVKLNSQCFSYFDEAQFKAFSDTTSEPLNDYEKLIWKYINKEELSVSDISPYIADALINSVKHLDVYLYTPIIIYIMRNIFAQ